MSALESLDGLSLSDMFVSFDQLSIVRVIIGLVWLAFIGSFYIKKRFIAPSVITTVVMILVVVCAKCNLWLFGEASRLYIIEHENFLCMSCYGFPILVLLGCTVIPYLAVVLVPYNFFVAAVPFLFISGILSDVGMEAIVYVLENAGIWVILPVAIIAVIAALPMLLGGLLVCRIVDSIVYSLG